ncbi:TPA: HAD family hydrolase [Candidatus Woesearchaeota archaeon]|nr:HAD family hydrolase [Candidatus Woesearchaeota archaeon]
MIKNVIFDWSGTLSNDLQQVYETVMKVFGHYGVARISLDEFRDSYTLPYMVHARMFGITVKKDEIDAVFASHFRNAGFPRPIPGVENVLEHLKNSGKSMVVFSSHRQNFLEEEELRFFGGSRFFERLFCDVDDKVDKIGEVVDAMRFEPKATILVGDTEHDIAAGHKAGLVTAAVLSGYRSKKHLEDAKPDFIV